LTGYDAYGVRALAFTSDGKTLAAIGVHDGIKLWDVATGKNTATLKTDKDPTVAAFTCDGKTLATSDYDYVDEGGRSGVKGWVKLWDVATGREQATLQGHTDRVCSMTFSPDGKTLAFGGKDGTIKLWDVAKDRELATLKGHTGKVVSLAYSADGMRLV